MPTLTRPDTTIAYQDTGAPAGRPDAPAILFGHGLFFGGWMFQPQIEALAPHYRCVSIDWRGQGQSPPAQSGYDMDTLTEDAVALIEHLNLAPVHFVGLSMGGFVGMRLAARRPELVRSLTLLNTAAVRDADEVNVGSAQLAGLMWAFGAQSVWHQPKEGTFGTEFLGDPANKAVLDEWLAHLERSDGHGVAAAVMGVIHRQPVTDELAQITAPTLVISGEQDAMPPEYGRAIAAAVPGARFELIPGCGHASTLDKPAAVTGLLDDFLAAH